MAIKMKLPNLFRHLNVNKYPEASKLLLIGPDSKYFRLVGHMTSATAPQFSYCGLKQPQKIHK